MYSIQDEIQRQSIVSTWCVSTDQFICKDCRYYKGGCGCERGVFIAFVGSNMSGCVYYDLGRKCPHCGRNF